MKTSIDELVKRFENATLAAYALPLQRETTKEWNRLQNVSWKAWKKLVEDYGDEGREGLSALLKHENVHVRLSAAVRLLRYRNSEAMAVLISIAKQGPNITAFEAQQALQRWEEGDWHLDPPE